MAHAPLVSIGMPTYNRVAMLQRAAEHALAQTYANLELVISDNASTDGTADYCRDLVARDARVRYLRQPFNVGPTGNYIAVLEAARGELYMSAADDDFLGPTWVGDCVAALRADPSLALATGRARMFHEGRYVRDGVITDILEPSPTARVVHFLSTVEENSGFHGVIRRDRMLALPRLQNCLGGDWIQMMHIAFIGRIRSVPTAGIDKSLGGASATFERIAEICNYDRRAGRFPGEAILLNCVRDVVSSPVYASLGIVGRARLAVRAAAAISRHFGLPYRWYRLVKERVLAAAS